MMNIRRAIPSAVVLLCWLTLVPLQGGEAAAQAAAAQKILPPAAPYKMVLKKGD